MPIKSETTPPPRIGKIGPYTVFVTPSPTPNPSLKPDSPKKPVDVPVQVQTPVQKVVQPPPPVQKVVQPPPPVMAPPVQYCEDKSVFAFFWDAVAKVQNAHAQMERTNQRQKHKVECKMYNASRVSFKQGHLCKDGGFVVMMASTMGLGIFLVGVVGVVRWLSVVRRGGADDAVVLASTYWAEIAHNVSTKKMKEIVECAAQLEDVVTNRLARLHGQEDE
ncbi:unnamed protein product [Fraxinus pennsylvanica]|uniref:Uncharacterized protein n=1 Tax=Fraxinus pennsylvanica TaxID=56036 RepID=A0AAD2ECG7_9LAMI|nr:unnamed protein product [Fraxinus pennsylvanica]